MRYHLKHMVPSAVLLVCAGSPSYALASETVPPMKPQDADYAHLIQMDKQPISALNSLQRKNIDEYIRDHESLTGEPRFTAVRDHIFVRSTHTLRDLFPQYTFVTIPWAYQIIAEAKGTYQIPEGTFFTLALNSDGSKRFVFQGGNSDGYGNFLHAIGMKLTTETMAKQLATAFTDIHGLGMCCKNIRHSDLEWRLGYHENPFRTISSYEEIREAYYYRVMTDASGIVTHGRLVVDELERRKTAKGFTKFR